MYDIPAIPDVSILIRQDYPLNRQLDASAGPLVLKKIEDMGVKVLTQCAPTDIITRVDDETREEVFAGFRVGDSTIDADLVIFAIGIKPRDDLAAISGIKCAPRGGIEVGDDLMTSAESIYAVGECASWRGNVGHFPRLSTLADPPPLADIRSDRSWSRNGRYSRFQPRSFSFSPSRIS